MSEPELPKKRLGMNIMPDDVPPDHTDHSAGTNGNAVGNVADTDGNVGGGGDGGGGGECEQYNCDCASIQDAINSYNDAVDSLSGSLDGLLTNLPLPDQSTPVTFMVRLKSLIQEINDKLKNIDAGLGDGTTPDCDDCGTAENLRNLLRKILPTNYNGRKHPGELGGFTRGGTDIGKLYSGCCGGGVVDPDDPFEHPGGPQTNDPCGRAGDSVENAKLFDCEPLDIDLGEEYDILKIPKLECKPKTSTCKDATGGITLDTIDGAEIKVPKLKKGATKLAERITQIDAYLKGLDKLTNKVIKLGGASGSLRSEACLTRLLDLMCSRQLTGGAEGVSDSVLIGTKIPIRGSACGAAGCTSNSHHCCHQLMNEIWKRTLTYGHTQNDKEGTAWNSKPNCGPEDAVTAKDKAYVGPNQSPADAVAARMSQLATAYPGGCGHSDGSLPPKAPRILPGSSTNCDENRCPCKDGMPGTLPDSTRKELFDLQKRLHNLREERTNLEKQKTAKLADEVSLLEHLEIRKKAGASQTDLEPTERAIEEVRLVLSRIDISINNLNVEEPGLAAGINTILNGFNIETGSYCIEFEYYYCAANSTPRVGTGQETNTNDLNPGVFHRNFFELLMAIKTGMKSLAEEMGCSNPLADHFDDCFGDQDGTKPALLPTGIKKNPKSKNNSNTLQPGASCSENDNVAELGSWFYPYCIGMTDDNPPRNKQDQPRAACIQKLFRIMKNWIKNSNQISGKLAELQKGLGNLDKEMIGIAVLAGNIKPTAPDVPCKGYTEDDVIKKLSEITKSVERAQDALEKINEIKTNF